MTLVGSPALDLAIASLTGRGRASAADSKIFKNSPGLLTFYKRLPTYLTTLLPLPPPYLPNITRPLRECGPVHPPPAAKKPLSVFQRERCHQHQEQQYSRQHPSGIACSQLFFFFFFYSPGHSSSTTRSLVPAPSVRPHVSVSSAQHPPNLPACLAYLEISFRAFYCWLDPTPDKRRLLSRTHLVRVVCPSVVDR
ncbi:hypothetical protein F5883DRAFT_8722 [Diaporthe sp. PMI_573]|nr:hypothetical protein F5883DRAFT_8722 [Diaporthaceae sp. PMI_573]